MARKTFTGSHLELRVNTYYAVLPVPKDVQLVLGKKKYFKTTKTGDRKRAEQVAAVLVAGWKRDIALARSSSPDPVINSALQLVNELKSHTSRHLVEEVIAEETDNLRVNKGEFISEVFSNIATGTNRHLSALIPDYSKTLEKRGLKKKSIDQMAADAEFLAKEFHSAILMTDTNVHAWLEGILKSLSTSTSTFKRTLSNFKGFFNYLKSINEVPKTARNPFTDYDYSHAITNQKGAIGLSKGASWVPFTREEVEELHQTAKSNCDDTLAQLIVIGAYTGMRLEEICSLRKQDVNTDKNFIAIVNAKTKAGIRTIPIHPDIAPFMANLKDTSTGAFILSGLTLNKYGDRSNAIGKRFGRMKSLLGHPETKVFHSIRKTFTTLLENAGVSENVAADIVGHEKPRITYGLYSGGTQLNVMSDAIKKIHYDLIP